MLGDHSTLRARAAPKILPGLGQPLPFLGNDCCRVCALVLMMFFEVSCTSCCSVMRRGVPRLVKLVSWKAQSGGSGLVMDNMKLFCFFFPPSPTTQSCPSLCCCLPHFLANWGKESSLAACHTKTPPALIYYHQNQLQMLAGPGLCCQLGRLMQRFLLCWPGTEESRG